MCDLWPDFEKFDNISLENHAIDILKEQASLLSDKTNGKVKAIFSEMSKPDLSSILRDSMKFSIYDDIDKKEDINKLYTFVDYKFEIYSDVYKFRVFVLKYRPIYPIQIEIDEGIREEKGYNLTENISNDNELIKIISSVFSSRKLQIIIKKIMEKS